MGRALLLALVVASAAVIPWGNQNQPTSGSLAPHELITASLLSASDSKANTDTTKWNIPASTSKPSQGSAGSSIAARGGTGLAPFIISPKSKYAFATLLTKDDPGYTIGTMMVGRSLKETGSLTLPAGNSVDLIVLIAADVKYSESTLAALKSTGFDIVRVGEIPSPFPEEKCGRFCDFYVKLRLWQLPYERVVYLDGDMLVRRNINDLFEAKLGAWPSAGAVLECGGQHRLPVNGGLYVLEPSQNTFADMYALRGKIEEPLVQFGQNWEYTEQTFLHAYFRRCFFDQNCDGSHLVELPPTYNALLNSMGKSCKKQDGELSPLTMAHVWHFTGLPKPWGGKEAIPDRNKEYFAEYRSKRNQWKI